MKITKGTKQYAKKNVNCIFGCQNNCKYCYAKRYAIRFGRATEFSWLIMRINNNILNKRWRKIDGFIMFPTAHDIFPFPEFKEACFTVLGNLLASGNKILLTTKPRLEVIKEICEIYSYFKDQIHFLFTITSANDNVLSFWEPGAPLFLGRIKAVRYAYEQGFKISVSIEPFLDRDPSEVINEVNSYVTNDIWIGIMTGIREKWYEGWEGTIFDVKKNYSRENLRNIYLKYKDRDKIRFKDNFINKLISLGVNLEHPIYKLKSWGVNL